MGYFQPTMFALDYIDVALWFLETAKSVRPVGQASSQLPQLVLVLETY